MVGSDSDQLPLGLMMGTYHDGSDSLLCLFNHNQLDALSAACITLFINVFLMLPVMPRILHIFHIEFPTKPLQPTSTGINHTFHPFPSHSFTKYVYFDVFSSFDVSIRSSHGTVSSKITSDLDFTDHSTISGLLFVIAMTSGNFNCLLRSASICQSSALHKTPVLLLLFVDDI